MALSHVVGVRNSLANVTGDAVDVGTTDAQGDLMIMTGGDVEVSIHACSNPAFLAPSAGVKNADTIGDDTTAAGGTAALFKFQNRDNAEVFRGTVTGTGGGGDIELDNVVVGVGVTVAISSFSYESSV